MPPTDSPMITPTFGNTVGEPLVGEMLIDEALDESFPASDPPAYTPRQAGRNDIKHDAGGLLQRLKERLSH